MEVDGVEEKNLKLNLLIFVTMKKRLHQLPKRKSFPRSDLKRKKNRHRGGMAIASIRKVVEMLKLSARVSKNLKIKMKATHSQQMLAHKDQNREEVTHIQLAGHLQQNRTIM